MKQVVIKLPQNPIVKMSGWLFIYAGLRLVVGKICQNHKWWVIYEYSTGCKVNWHSADTRKGTMEIVKKELDKRGSVDICKAIQFVLERESKFLNI